tara:strand:+ start:251 stop:670 length:420 start_codon:yes stop_codon:yes gene_type:complete
MEHDDIKTAWISRGWNLYKKPWGYEHSWSSFTAGHGKLLFIESGHRTSLKFNPQKCESLIVISGSVNVTYGDELSLDFPDSHPLKTERLEVGDTLHVQSRCPYRISAIKDSRVVEIGNFLSDAPFRIEDDYGRGDEKGS